MFGHLRGTIARMLGHGFVVDVGGVGYVVHVSASCAARFDVGDEVMLLIHTHVSDSAISLYGFEGEDQMWLFTQLIGVNGVGPKLAMNILSIGTCEAVMRAIAAGDVAYLTQVSGVGKRTAERVVVDLKDKVGAAPAGVGSPIGSKLADVVDALVAMGYGQQEARDVVSNMSVGEERVEDLIREALKFFATR